MLNTIVCLSLIGIAKVTTRMSLRMCHGRFDKARGRNSIAALDMVGTGIAGGVLDQPSQYRGMTMGVRKKLDRPDFRPMMLREDEARFVLRHPHDWTSSERAMAIEALTGAIAERDAELRLLAHDNKVLLAEVAELRARGKHMIDGEREEYGEGE